MQVLAQRVLADEAEKDLSQLLRIIRDRNARDGRRVRQPFEMLFETEEIELIGLFVMVGANAFVDRRRILKAVVRTWTRASS